jgi:hypothetical protein
MKTLQHHLSTHQRAFAEHPFFVELARPRPLSQQLAFVPKLTFWVMAFQDLLRLGEQVVREPRMQRIARHHRREDAKHELWFLQDLAELQQPEPGVSTLFGAGHSATRDATYVLAAELLRASDDRLRVLLLLALEATGHVFFGHISRLVAEHGMEGRLKYFSDYHLQVERAHEVFERKVEEELFSEVLDEARRQEGVLLLERAFGAFIRMFDGFLTDILSTEAPAEAGVRPLNVA